MSAGNFLLEILIPQSSPPVKTKARNLWLGKASGFVDTSSDAAIASGIKAQLMLTKGIKASNYKIVVENGIVYVMGIKTSSEEWESARAVIADTAGVQKIIYLMHPKQI